MTYRACLLCLALALMAPTAATAQRCRVADVAVAPSNPQIRPGDTLSLFATGYDAKGMPCAMAEFTWSSSNVQIARMDAQSGRVKGVGAGVAIITARTGMGRVAKSGRAVVTVATAKVHVAEVAVNPRDAQVQVGGRTLFVATAYDRANNPIAFAAFVWLSSNPAVATIDQNGIAKGVAPGVATITVRVGMAAQAKTAQARLQVSTAVPNAPRPAHPRPQ